MHGKKNPRSQNDGKQEEFSHAARTHTPGVDTARQEFGKSTDINHILDRHGVAGLRQAATGAAVQEVNYDLDLQGALGAIAAARQAFRRMSKETQQKYGTWMALLNAVEAGEFKMPEDPAKPADRPPPPDAPPGEKENKLRP